MAGRQIIEEIRRFQAHPFWNCAPSLRQFQAAFFAYLQVLHLHLNTLRIGADVVVRVVPFTWRWRDGRCRVAEKLVDDPAKLAKHLELRNKHGDIKHQERELRIGQKL